MRIKISRKEAKETLYWLRLIQETSETNDKNEILKLIEETNQIKKILSSIILKTQ